MKTAKVYLCRTLPSVAMPGNKITLNFRDFAIWRISWTKRT